MRAFAEKLHPLADLPSLIEQTKDWCANMADVVNDVFVKGPNPEPDDLRTLTTEELGRRERALVERVHGMFLPGLEDSLIKSISIRTWSGCIEGAKTISTEPVARGYRLTPEERSKLYEVEIGPLARRDHYYRR